MKAEAILGAYLDAIGRVHATRAGTKETSYYPAFTNLLNTVGERLKPRVFCLNHVSGRQAGIPDFGLFEQRRFRRGEAPEWRAGIIPDRGVAELKAADHDIGRLLASDQVRKQYLPAYNLVLASTARGAALIQRLLAFSRRQSLAPRAVELNALIESLTAFLERTPGRGIAIRLTLDPAAGDIFIDPAQPEVAILNLAVNAKDAMAGNGVLQIETSAPAHGGWPADGGHVRLTIGDTGCGTSQEVLAQVFEPFFTTKQEGQGTGLGLSQAYGFITQSGGQIRIDSEPGRGTRVHLFLPRPGAADPAPD